MKLFRQSNTPANQNLLYKTEEDAQKAIVGELDICLDETTGFIYNCAFDPDKVDYSGEYNNNQIYSPYFFNYINKQIQYLIEKYIPWDSTIVEVGCGKGYYIKKMAMTLGTCKAYGFDTSYVQDDDIQAYNVRFFKEYYDEKYSDLHPDIVICRHVIEHIHNPLEFLKGIRASMPEHSLLFIETPDVNWILRNAAIFDFFYEHCSYWNKDSIEQTLRLSGFEPIEARSEFEGQYMWIVSRAVSNDKIAICPNNRSANIKELCRKFVTDREYEIRTVARSLRLLKQQNYTVYIWGAGAKGTTFVNLFDEEKQFVLALVDINPEKQNKFVGKTAHKVICPQKMQDILINDNGGG